MYIIGRSCMFITSRSLRVKRFGRYIRIYTLADRYIYSRSHDLFARWCHDILIHAQILITSGSIVGGCRDANWLFFKLIVFISFHRWNFMDVEEATRLFLKLIILFCSRWNSIKWCWCLWWWWWKAKEKKTFKCDEPQQASYKSDHPHPLPGVKSFHQTDHISEHYD